MKKGREKEVIECKGRVVCRGRGVCRRRGDVGEREYGKSIEARKRMGVWRMIRARKKIGVWRRMGVWEYGEDGSVSVWGRMGVCKYGGGWE